MYRSPLALALTVALIAGTASADAPRVAADIAPVHSLVARVMDGVGQPDLIVAPGASPHEHSLRPSEANALQEADLVFWIGESLTPWMDGALETLAADAAVTELLDVDGITALGLREDALFEAHGHEDEGHDGDDEHADDGHGDDHDDHADEDHEDGGHGDDDHADDHAEGDHEEDHGDEGRAHGDHEGDGHADADGHGHGHGEHDPHAWLSPDNAAVWLDAIAAALSAADPGNAYAYAANAAAGREELAALGAEIDARLDPVRGRNFVVFHDAYQYFEDAFGLSATGAIALSDASDPSPARVERIQRRIRDEDIGCVLAEPQFNDALIATVTDGTRARTAVIDPIGVALEPGPSLYPALLRGMAESLNGCR